MKAHNNYSYVLMHITKRDYDKLIMELENENELELELRKFKLPPRITLF